MFSIFERRLDPYPQDATAALPRKFFGFVWASVRGARRYLLMMVVMTAAIGLFEAWLFSVLGKVVNWLSSVPPERLWRQERSHLFVLGAVLFGSIFAVALQSLIKQQTLSGSLAMRLRWIFHRNMLAQSLSFYQQEFAGRVATKVMQTALAVRDTWMIIADVLVYLVIYFATISFVVGVFSPLLLVPFVFWLVAYLLSCWYFVPRLGTAGQLQADARSLMTGRITDAYTNITTVKLFSHAQRESSYVKEAMSEFLLTVRTQQRLVTGFEIVNQVLSAVLLGATGAAALWLWTAHDLGVGAVAAGLAMAMRLSGISHWMMWEMASLFEQVGTVQDGINTLAHQPTVVDKPHAQPLRVSKGEIRFENVRFAYDGGRMSAPVIETLNLHIRPGERIGLVGRSGGGKSTLLNLLLQFYDVTEGRILIDGQDIAAVTQESLRAQIAMVTQDTSLLHRSILENIVYGRPSASQAEVLRAAERAQATEFIAGLRDSQGRVGFDAHVGERGVKLSGGQRQRIAIARVILKDAPILLLDEATSALDSEVEVAIREGLYELMESKTVVAIAHRLSTIAAMDRLIVLDRGRIVEEGDHRSLLARNGLYATLWAHQSGGLLGESLRPAMPKAVELE